jgi:hypothetical protein
MNQKKYWEMNTEELAEATKQFDEECVADRARPLTPEEREQWQRVKRKRGRPRRGAGVQVVSVSLEKGLLQRTDRLRKKLGLKRAEFISQALQRAIAEHEADGQ